MSIRAEEKQGKKTGRWIAEPRLSPYRVKQTFLTKYEAQEWHEFQISKFREYKRREALGKIVKDYSFPEAVNEWMKDYFKESAKFHLRKVVREMGDVLLKDALKKARDWRTQMQAEGLKPATINKKMTLVNSIFKFAYEHDMIEKPIHGKIRKLPGEESREVFLTDIEITRLCSAIEDNEARKAVIIACYTGIRRGELLQLTKADINTEFKLICLDGKITKNGKPRYVNYLEFLEPMLLTLPLKTNKTQLRWWFEKARKKAGLEHVRFHDLRHTYASLLQEQEGYSEFLGMELLGHSSLKMTSRYTHSRNHDIKKRLVDNISIPGEIIELFER